MTTEPKNKHREGDCQCTSKQRRIIRVYLGYGHCATCGHLTPEKIRRTERNRE